MYIGVDGGEMVPSLWYVRISLSKGDDAVLAFVLPRGEAGEVSGDWDGGDDDDEGIPGGGGETPGFGGTSVDALAVDGRCRNGEVGMRSSCDL